MFDTHCHLLFPDFADDLDGVIADAVRVGVDGMISIATSPEDAELSAELASRHPRVWCSSGIHPLHVTEADPDWHALRRAAATPRCVAWGELGLDMHYDDPPIDLQRRVLAEQLARIEAWRAEDACFDLPVVIHCRKAFDALLPILRASALPSDRFVFHCFTGTPDEARAVLDFGAMISLTGVVTYPNAAEVAQAAKLIPDDRIMVETDAPFLSPVPHRGKRPCKPAYVTDTARFLADLRGVSFQRFEQITDANVLRFFGIEAPPGDRT